MTDVRSTLIDVKEEYRKLYFHFVDNESYESARLVLDKLFVIEQIEKGERNEMPTMQE